MAKVTGGLRKSHNEALHDSYISANMIKFINSVTVIYKKCPEQQQNCYWLDQIMFTGATVLGCLI